MCDSLDVIRLNVVPNVRPLALLPTHIAHPTVHHTHIRPPRSRLASQVSDLNSQTSDPRPQVSDLRAQISDLTSRFQGPKSQVSDLCRKPQVKGSRLKRPDPALLVLQIAATPFRPPRQPLPRRATTRGTSIFFSDCLSQAFPVDTVL